MLHTLSPSSSSDITTISSFPFAEFTIETSLEQVAFSLSFLGDLLLHININFVKTLLFIPFCWTLIKFEGVKVLTKFLHFVSIGLEIIQNSKVECCENNSVFNFLIINYIERNPENSTNYSLESSKVDSIKDTNNIFISGMYWRRNHTKISWFYSTLHLSVKIFQPSKCWDFFWTRRGKV